MADYTVAKIDELEGFYNGLFLKARAALGVTAFGLSIVDIPAHSVHYPEHNHPSGQEEVLICIGGFGRLIMDESSEVFVDLEPGVMVRIGAKTKRTIRVGDEGLQADRDRRHARRGRSSRCAYTEHRRARPAAQAPGHLIGATAVARGARRSPTGELWAREQLTLLLDARFAPRGGRALPRRQPAPDERRAPRAAGDGAAHAPLDGRRRGRVGGARARRRASRFAAAAARSRRGGR